MNKNELSYDFILSSNIESIDQIIDDIIYNIPLEFSHFKFLELYLIVGDIVKNAWLYEYGDDEIRCDSFYHMLDGLNKFNKLTSNKIRLRYKNTAFELN